LILFKLDNKWYKEPEKFHETVVEYLTEEGKKSSLFKS